MPICNKCNSAFPNRIKIDSIVKNICNRKYCLICSPYKKHNTKKIENYSSLEPGHKHCSDCKKAKVFVDFYQRTGSKFYYSCCKDCQKRKSAKQRDTKLKCVIYKGGKCHRCGYNACVQALDFHHVDGVEKKFSISSARNKKFEELKIELDKCVMICSNCHREIHAGIWNLEDLNM